MPRLFRGASSACRGWVGLAGVVLAALLWAAPWQGEPSGGEAGARPAVESNTAAVVGGDLSLRWPAPAAADLAPSMAESFAGSADDFLKHLFSLRAEELARLFESLHDFARQRGADYEHALLARIDFCLDEHGASRQVEPSGDAETDRHAAQVRAEACSLLPVHLNRKVRPSRMLAGAAARSPAETRDEAIEAISARVEGLASVLSPSDAGYLLVRDAAQTGDRKAMAALATWHASGVVAGSPAGSSIPYFAALRHDPNAEFDSEAMLTKLRGAFDEAEAARIEGEARQLFYRCCYRGAVGSAQGGSSAR